MRPCDVGDPSATTVIQSLSVCVLLAVHRLLEGAAAVSLGFRPMQLFSWRLPLLPARTTYLPSRRILSTMPRTLWTL